MCTNQRLIHSRYSKRSMYVKCGRCKACQQEKAAKRVRRINDTKLDSYCCLMVTLTYSQGTCPYILREDAYNFANGDLLHLPVYRDCYIRKVRKVMNGDDYAQIYRRVTKRVLLENVEFSSIQSLSKTKDLKHEFGKIGVCYYKDYQHFLARLRLNLKRHYNYENKIFVYACDEYGIKSHRPHFHLLVFCEKSAEKILRCAIIESWPFSNLSRFPRAIERCYKGASYVASYVNQSSNFPSFFKHYFKQKHSYSKGFGMGNSKYDLSFILEKFERGSLKYAYAQNKDGYTRIFDVPFPSYVINRYFPKFKGYTTCSPIEVLSYMQRICRGDSTKIRTYNRVFPYKMVDFLQHDKAVLYGDEVHKIRVRLLNAYERFKSFAPEGVDKTLDGYLQLHINIWNLYNATLLRLIHENQDIPLWEKYDNLNDINNDARLRCVLGFDINFRFDVVDPNEFVSVKRSTCNYADAFDDHIKHKSVSNAIYLASVEDCEL